MKNKSIRYLVLSCCIMGTLFLGGCGQATANISAAPKAELINNNAIVQVSNKDTLEELEMTLKAPTHFNDDVIDTTGNLKVIIDADVIVPKVHDIASYKVSEKKWMMLLYSSLQMYF